MVDLKEWVADFQSGYKDPDVISQGKSNYNYNNKEFYEQNMNAFANRKDHFEINMEVSKPGLVMTSIKTKNTYCLKSDQFGFSAPSDKLNHTYDIYLQKVIDERLDLEKAYEKVKCWVKKTRQAGGSFFWPMEPVNGGYNLNPKINVLRGGTKDHGSYIKDRVDLTLLEIKAVYDSGILQSLKKFSNLKTLENNILASQCLISVTMINFLSDFDSFSDYVDFFGFDLFVGDENVPYNILKKKPTVLDEDSKYKGALYNEAMKAGDYETIFDNIVRMIEERRRILKISL